MTALKDHHPNLFDGRIYLFGALRAEAEGCTEALPGGKAGLLLAYLCLHGPRAHAREPLIEQMWPERAPAAGRRALSDALYRLRQSPAGAWIVAGPDQVQLADPTRLWVDVWAFERLSAVPARAEEALALYRGDLLEGVYDDWLPARRYALRERYLDLLLQTGNAAHAAGAFDVARQRFQRLLAEDPLDERAYLGLMQSLARAQRRAEALSVYQRLVTTLADELDVAPSEAAQALAKQLRMEADIARVPAPGESATFAGAAAEPNLLRPAFVGRREERRLLLTAVENALRGRGGTIAIEGDAGMGKSRLLDEIAAGAAWRGAAVVRGAAGERPGTSSFSALAQATQAALSGLHGAQAEALLAPAIRAAAAPLYPPWQAEAPLGELPPDAAQMRFHTAILDLYSTLTALTPHVLIVDDMHWATADQWAALDALVSQAARLPLLILMGYRRTPIEEGPGWKYLQQWEGRGDLVPQRLTHLEPKDIVELLPARYHDEAAQIHAITGGNPYFIRETLLGLQTMQRPYRLTVERRLAMLQPDERRLLEAAAVTGDGAPYFLWQAVAQLEAPAIARLSRRLIDAYLLQVDETTWRFPHELIRNAVYAALDAAQRRALHGRAAATLATQLPEAIQLRAYHLAAAGEDKAAGMLYQAVAEAAARTFAYADAQRTLAQALRLAPPDDPHARLVMLTNYAQVCAITGDRAEQASSLTAALALAQDLNDQAAQLALLIETAHLAFLNGDEAAAGAQLQQAEALAHRTNDVRQLVAIYLHQGDVKLHFGRSQTAVAVLEQALQLAREHGDRAQEGRALDGLAWAYSNLNEPPTRTLPLYEQAIAAQVAAGNQFEEARARINYLSGLQNVGAWDRAAHLMDATLAAQQRTGYIRGEGAARQARGLIALALGDFAGAQEEAAAALAIFERIGERLGAIIAMVSLGNVAHCCGDSVEAEALRSRALEAATEIGSPIFEGFALQDLGVQYVEEARYAEAIPLLERAVANWRETGERLSHYYCATYVALAQLAQGEREKAAAIARDVWQAFEEDHVTGDKLQQWYWSLAQLMAGLDRPAQEAAALRAAYAELQRQARAIGDHSVRRRFLYAVPGNLAIIAAHDRLTRTKRQATVTLARLDAPLGRALDPAEVKTIEWTVIGPEDEAIEDRPARRRYRLLRLMDAAFAQGVAPTDHDLAAALQVSRRTILRDLAALTAAGEIVRTRARQ